MLLLIVIIQCIFPAAFITQQSRPAGTPPVGAKGSYVILQGGVNVGTTSYEMFEDAGGGLRLHGVTIIETPQAHVEINTDTFLPSAGTPSRYQLSARVGSGVQRLEVAINGSTAHAAFTVGSTRSESDIELPQNWAILDNNSSAHLALFAARLRPDMEQESGRIFVPSTLTLADYNISYQGAAAEKLAGEEVQAQVFTMIIADTVEVRLSVYQGRMLAMRQPAQGIEFLLQQ